tara:strand:+ start:62 stop:826 length:765 start_codon:yes stop_codon:yes gene_type:complete
MNSLENKVILITGGAGRLGASFSKAIIKSGGKVIVNDIDKSKGEKLIQELGKDNSMLYHGDLTKTSLIADLIKSGFKKFNKIDGAVYCAYPTSSNWGTALEELDPKSLREDLYNQLGLPILFSKEIIKFFREQGYGNLIHISSIQGISAPKFEHYISTNMVSPVEYSAIKSGIINITKYLSKYCKNQNIRINCISPGGIFSNQPDSFIKKYKEECFSKGILDPEDINGALLFLLSEESKYINGQNIVVDDGWSI